MASLLGGALAPPVVLVLDSVVFSNGTGIGCRVITIHVCVLYRNDQSNDIHQMICMLPINENSMLRGSVFHVPSNLTSLMYG